MEISVLIALLKQGKLINRSSWALFAITALSIAYLAPFRFAIIAVLIAFVLLIAQTYYALRIAMDYEFFQLLQSESTSIENLEAFDQILLKHKLIKNLEPDTTRSLDNRIAGIICLVKLQITYLVLQVALYPLLLIMVLCFFG